MAAPIDRILVETDSPYLAPAALSVANVTNPPIPCHTAAKGAEVFGLDIDAFALQLEENFDRLFTKGDWIGADFDVGSCGSQFWDVDLRAGCHVWGHWGDCDPKNPKTAAAGVPCWLNGLIRWDHAGVD